MSGKKILVVDDEPHVIRTLTFVLKKEGKKVFGTTGNLVHKNLKVDDYGSALVEFESGIKGIVESTWLVVPPAYTKKAFISSSFFA